MSLKKLLLGFVGLSNLAVVSLVLGVYFQNNYQTSRMYSTSPTIGTSESDLKDKIKKQCGKELENVIKGERTEFICGISMKGYEKGSSYVLKTKVVLKKRTNGFTVKGTGSMNSKTRYATEADFCNSCEEKSEVTSLDKDTIFGQIFDIAKTIDQKAASAVVNAQEVYREKDLKKRRSLLKQKRCKGTWNEEAEEFIEYDVEEVLECKISKLDKMDSNDLIQKEAYYNDTLKTDLWEMAFSDDYDLLNKATLYKLQNKHFRHNLSVRNSTNTIDRYLSWKDEYADKGFNRQVEDKLQTLIKNLQNLSHIDQNLLPDYQYLTQRHSPVTSSLPQHVGNPAGSVTGTVSSPTSLKTQVQDLY